MTEFAKDREFEPCPCCGADALVFDERMEPALSRILGNALDEKIDVKLAQRWTCDCWKRARCVKCSLCATHCLCAAPQVMLAAKRREEAYQRKKATRKAFVAASVELPLDLPEVKVERAQKNVKGRK